MRARKTCSQVRPYDPTPASVAQLVHAFFANDPYYPRPRAGSQLYADFKTAYLAECVNEAQGLDQAFIQAIEQKQAERDSDQGTNI